MRIIEVSFHTANCFISSSIKIKELEDHNKNYIELLQGRYGLSCLFMSGVKCLVT